jgi:hypothetical protein
MDMNSLIKPEFIPENGDLWPAISILHGSGEILEQANRAADDQVKRDLISAVRKNLQNVIDALADPEQEQEEDE